MRTDTSIVLVVLAVTLSCCYTIFVAAASDNKNFERFFGTTPVPDRNLERQPSAWIVPVNSGSLRWLSLLPTWPQMKQTATTNKKNETVVVPFDDEIATVRVLGGWDSKYGHGNASDDIIDENYNFRWDLLDQRIDQWAPISSSSHNNSDRRGSANRSILFVLDNVPYVFTNGHPKLGPFGQDAPPTNYTKFHWFVKQVVLHLQQRYGVETVANRFRFRVGTEPDGPRYGNETEYLHSYVAAATAVKEVSPRSPVGAGNWLHQDKDYNQNQQFELDFYRQVAEFEKQTNQTGVLVNFVAQSDYVQGRITPGGRRFPCYIRQGADAMKKYVQTYQQQKASTATTTTTTTSMMTKKYYPKVNSIPIQVHEFAPLYNRAKRTSVEPGSFGVSFYVACWSVALSSGIDRIFHWGTNHEPGADGELWTGLGWAMAMADVLVGKPFSRVDVPEKCQRGTYALVSLSANNKNTNKGVTLVTAFDPYRDATFSEKFLLPHDVSQAFMIDSETSPFDEMLRQAMSNNYTQFSDGLPYGIHTLLNAAGQKWIRQRDVWNQFMNMQQSVFSPVKNFGKMRKGDVLKMKQFTTYLLM